MQSDDKYVKDHKPFLEITNHKNIRMNDPAVLAFKHQGANLPPDFVSISLPLDELLSLLDQKNIEAFSKHMSPDNIDMSIEHIELPMSWGRQGSHQ